MDHLVYDRIKWCAERQAQSERVGNLISYMTSPNSNKFVKKAGKEDIFWKSNFQALTFLQEFQKKEKNCQTDFRGNFKKYIYLSNQLSRWMEW